MCINGTFHAECMHFLPQYIFLWTTLENVYCIVFVVVVVFKYNMSQRTMKPTIRRATSEDSDQPEHPRSLIRICVDRMCLLQPPGYPKKYKREHLPYWVDAQADLSLRWSHKSYCWFCRALDHIVMNVTYVAYFLKQNNLLQQYTSRNMRKYTTWRESKEDSDQSAHPYNLINLRCPHEETLHPWLSKIRLLNIMITGWSESSLGAHVRINVFFFFFFFFFFFLILRFIYC